MDCKNRILWFFQWKNMIENYNSLRLISKLKSEIMTIIWQVRKFLPGNNYCDWVKEKYSQMHANFFFN